MKRDMELESLFAEQTGLKPAYLARAPGRVNLLGEHVDYNDGIVLPVALELEVKLAAALEDMGRVNLYALDLNEQVSFELANLEARQDIHGMPLPDWALYPAGTAWSLQQAGLELAGLTVVYTSDVPIGAGLSSSAAVEVGFAVLWQAAGEWKLDPLDLARLCQRAENKYVGVACGLMDQFASACGVEGHALYFDTRSLAWQPEPLPEDYTIVIADSGVRRSLSGSAYNERRASCEQAVQILKKYLPEITALRDVSPPVFAAYRDFLPPPIRRRAEHVVREIARVETAANALRRSDARAFGAVMFSGHASLRDLYEVSTSELDTLVEIARQLPGCLGARLTGAGFGGCTVNLVKESDVEGFASELQKQYHLQTGREATVFPSRAGAGASARKLG
ncbi:MAG TPA: galactokinase [Anaerolineales bacterium]|nr:galactokinase [Anaerolineales bacterium]